MVKFGIIDKQRFLDLGDQRWRSGPHVAYNLLAAGDSPTPENIRVFEDLSFVLRMSNGTYRTSFRNRFADVNAVAFKWIEQLFPSGTPLRIEDRAVSHGLTSAEWITSLLPAYPNLSFEASDMVAELLELKLDSGEIYITEADGTPLQYIRPPFVVSVFHPVERRYPVNRWIAGRARRLYDALQLPAGWQSTTAGPGYRVRRISLVHPEMRALEANPRVTLRPRSVFERTSGCHVIRTMNILNHSYFSKAQLAEACDAIFASLVPGGLWIVGRTVEHDLSNRATFLQRTPERWQILERIGDGSELEYLALGETGGR